MVQIDTFQSLCERFPTWDELSAHLTSPAGGSLRIVGIDGTPYAIIRYTKGVSNMASTTTGLFRSVVWDTTENRPVCFAPPKAQIGNPPLHTNFSAVEDFIDGFMVNVFIAAGSADLNIVTRTAMGGENKFYSDKTFRQLFEEALAATPIRTTDALRMHLRELLTEKDLTSVFVSFIVQHPEHRVVAKVDTPDLHIVHVGGVSQAIQMDVWETAASWPAPLRRLQIARYPVRQFHTEQEIQDLMRRTAVSNGFRWQGLVFKDGAGARWRIRSPSYLMLRGLRGGEANPLDRFLRLRDNGLVMEYLKHYGEDRAAFWKFEQTLRARTADVLTAYERVHKAHEQPFADLPTAFKPAVHLLHVKYLTELREKGYKVLLRNAIDVVNRLKPFEQRRLMEAEPLPVVEDEESVVA